jgi:hypothetical protein
MRRHRKNAGGRPKRMIVFVILVVIAGLLMRRGGMSVRPRSARAPLSVAQPH